MPVSAKCSSCGCQRNLYRSADYTTGGPSSSCEMIILRNNSHGGIIRVCMGIFTTALRNKKYVKFSKKKNLTLLPQCVACYLTAYFDEKSPFKRVVYFEVFNVHKGFSFLWAACDYTKIKVFLFLQNQKPNQYQECLNDVYPSPLHYRLKIYLTFFNAVSRSLVEMICSRYSAVS